MNVTQVQSIPMSCAACGVPIVHPVGVGDRKEFCSNECWRMGRAFCKGCGKPLTQKTGIGNRKIFCSELCGQRYRRIGTITPTLLEEWNRTECIVCGDPITQLKRGKRKFCSSRCVSRYRRTGYDKRALYEEWGTYGPETQKVLREVQLIAGIAVAKRLATAIDREYKRYNYNRFMQKRDEQTGSRAKLTWEKVDEIRKLHVTEHLSYKIIAAKYGVSPNTIRDAINYDTWKPEDDPRRKAVQS